MAKPYREVIAAYYLGAFVASEVGEVTRPRVGKEPSYNRRDSADGTRVQETAVVPLNQLNPRTTSDLENMISRFK